MIELVKKINAVMHDLGAVPKEGKNTSQNYAYLAHADLMKALHPLLVKHGLVIFPKRVRLDTCVSYQWPDSGKPDAMTKRQNRTAVEIHYNITDGVDTIEFGGIGEGVDSQDKSAYKAQTGAHKYALKGLFCIPDELDAEDERFEEKARNPLENGQKPGAVNKGKAGAQRALDLKQYNEAGFLTDKEIADAKKLNKVTYAADLPSDVADVLINLALDRETVANDKKKEAKK